MTLPCRLLCEALLSLAQAQALAGSADAGQSGVAVTTDNQLANGSAANVIQVMVRDAGGDPVRGTLVSFAATPGVDLGAGVGAAATCTTAATGLCVTSARSTTAARYATPVTVSGAPLTGSFGSSGISYVASSALYSFVTGAADAGRSGVAVTADDQLADGRAANAIQVMVRDADGSPVSGTTVSFAATAGVDLGAGVGMAATCTTAATGLCAVSARSARAARRTTAVTVGGIALSGSFGSSGITYTASPAGYGFMTTETSSGQRR
jgi:hypothetical protein